MIPKIIHYCWFGKGPLPPLAIKCIESWKKYLPDYEIMEWTEDNFDINIIPYTKEAYQAKKYAFVSDYARLWILYNYGGLYFDTDVEIIKPINDIIAKGAFMGCEKEADIDSITAVPVAPGLGLGCNPGLGLYKQLLNIYNTLHFINVDGSLNQKTIVEYTTELLVNYGLKNINEIQYIANIWIYPKEYFCPIDYKTNKCIITKETRSIHHYAASWYSVSDKIKYKIARLIGSKRMHFLGNIKRSIYKLFK